MILKPLINLIARWGDALLNAGWQAENVRMMTTLAVFLSVVLFSYGLYWLVRLVLVRIVHKVAKQYKNRVGELLVARHVVRRASYVVILAIFSATIPGIFEQFPFWISPLKTLLSIGILWFAVRIITGALWCVVDYQAVYQQDKHRSFKGLIQFANILVYFLGGIVLLSILLDKSPLVFIGGLGAASAVLMLIFKDSLLGLVAGVQLSYNDIIRIGDWITMDKFNADGTVIDITLTTVKVQNFDLTVTTIPAYNLISDSVVNWRSMSEAQHRRIQREIHLDITGIRFCSPAFLSQLSKEADLGDFMNSGIEMPQDGVTNIYLYRKYIEYYLSRHPHIDHSPDYLLMARQLPAEDTGLPIQIYCFANTSEWVKYENIQADIFDHLLAMAPAFSLSVFERTAQKDQRLDCTGRPTL